MQSNLRGRNFISDLDFSVEEIETILDVAWDLKQKRALREPMPYLRDKVMGMYFFTAVPAPEQHLKQLLLTWVGILHLLKAEPHKFRMGIRNARSARY